MTKPHFFGLSERGHVRTRNEDNWFAASKEVKHGPSGLFIVSDGISARPAGALASKLVVEVLPELLQKKLHGIKRDAEEKITKHTRQALSELSEHVYASSKKRAEFSGMGATIVMALLLGNRALIAHLGDSRLYLLRDDHLFLLTHDHSVLQYLEDAGELQVGERSSHPARHQITQYIGMEDTAIPASNWLQLQPGDRLLLCSDGLNRMLDSEQIEQVIQTNDTCQSAAEALVKAALNAGGKDNVTVIVIEP